MSLPFNNNKLYINEKEATLLSFSEHFVITFKKPNSTPPLLHKDTIFLFYFLNKKKFHRTQLYVIPFF